uniref:uncharacterized protein LOC118153648 n=1 Tax=Callithrix jacchus TaxID=9483 RepID=UPI0023DD3612|nr:uncharacterized protein LOC118153648 [Callithrix jacchus]
MDREGGSSRLAPWKGIRAVLRKRPWPPTSQTTVLAFFQTLTRLSNIHSSGVGATGLTRRPGPSRPASSLPSLEGLCSPGSSWGLLPGCSTHLDPGAGPAETLGSGMGGSAVICHQTVAAHDAAESGCGTPLVLSTAVSQEAPEVRSSRLSHMCLWPGPRGPPQLPAGVAEQGGGTCRNPARVALRAQVRGLPPGLLSRPCLRAEGGSETPSPGPGVPLLLLAALIPPQNPPLLGLCPPGVGQGFWVLDCSRRAVRAWWDTASPCPAPGKLPPLTLPSAPTLGNSLRGFRIEHVCGGGGASQVAGFCLTCCGDDYVGASGQKMPSKCRDKE